MLQQFIMPPTFLLVELSDNCIDQLVFPIKYGYVRSKLCIERHGSMCKSSFYSGNEKWHSLGICTVNDMCDSVKNYTSCQDFFHSNYPKGWFFVIFEKSKDRHQ